MFTPVWERETKSYAQSGNIPRKTNKKGECHTAAIGDIIVLVV